jgi:hypothetical protein
MTPTLRRLDDRERYWGLPWTGWVAATAAAGALYVAVRFSPLGTKPTITLTLFILAFAGMVLYGVSGQALSPGRQLLAILSYRRSRKLLELSDRVERRGLVLDSRPPHDAPTARAGDADDAERDDLFGGVRVDDEEIDVGEDWDAGDIAEVGQAWQSPDEDGWGDDDLGRADVPPSGSSGEDR